MFVIKTLSLYYIINLISMAIMSVEVPYKIAKTFQPFTIIKYEMLVEKSNSDIEFNFQEENINQNEFLSYLSQKLWIKK